MLNTLKRPSDAGNTLGFGQTADQVSATGANMEASTAPVGTLNQMANFLTSGYWGLSNGSTRSWDTSNDNIITVNISGLNAEGKQLAQWAFEAWENVADIDFQITGSADADMTFDDNQSGAFASSSSRNGNIVSADINVSSSWLNSGATIDSYAFQTYIHEIGHALGLGHQGDYNGSATYGTDENFANDSWQLSVMSYFSQTENESITASRAGVISAQMVDTLAIQNLYGASTATAGNTIWGEGTNLNSYLATVFDAISSGTTVSGEFNGRAVTFTIFDHSGIDTVDVSYSTTDDRIDMREEKFSDLGGLVGNVGIARDTVIENLSTGSGDDTVTGNAAGNIIRTNGGNDTVDAGNGNDTLIGGTGNDALTGDGGADRIMGQSGNDTLLGEVGNDVLLGGAGADVLNGGNGFDRAQYSDATARVIADLQRAELNTGYAAGDTYISIERLFGSALNDSLRGDDAANVLWGQDGNDKLHGRGGDDVLFGMNGNDILRGHDGNDRLSGGAGADQFVFQNGFGRDRITDFNTSQSGEVINLDAVSSITSFADLSNNHLSQSGTDTIINDGQGNTITLLDVDVGDLSANDFLF